MKRFLYYLPGAPGANTRILEDRGILGRFLAYGGRVLEHGITGIKEGPDGGSGCIVATGSNPPGDLVQQDWHRGEKVWVGFEDLAARPGPEDLVREVTLFGYDLVLADGQTWNIPLLWRWDEDHLEHVPHLPRTLSTEGGGRPAALIRSEFRPLDALAKRTWQAFAREERIPVDRLFADAVEALAANYRIGLPEASLLGLLDEVLARKILGLAIDLPRIEAQAAAMAIEGLQVTPPRIAEEEF